MPTPDLDALVVAINRLEDWNSQDVAEIKHMIAGLRDQNRRLWRLIDDLEGTWVDRLHDLDAAIRQAVEIEPSWPALVEADVLRVNSRKLLAWIEKREKGATDEGDD